MSRLPFILRENFNKVQQKLFENITRGKRGEGRTPEMFLTPEGGMKGPFNAWFFSPMFGDAVQRLGEVVRFENSIPPPLRELAILVVAVKWQALYEFWAHEKIARKEGLDPKVITGLKTGILPDFTHPSEEVVYNFARELIDQQRVSNQLYAKAVELLGEAGVVELVILLGFYTLVSMSINVFEVPLPDGEVTPFKHADA
jgi:4-carboxymuconolactone decarboxylase